MLRKFLLAGAFMLCTVGLGESLIDVNAPRASDERRVLQQNTPHGTGGIEGRVIDAEGQPVARAIVIYTRVDDTGMGKIQPLVRTNRRGGFSLEGLGTGTYIVHALKEEDGHPYTGLKCYGTGLEVVPQVVVNAGETTSDVVVQFGPRAPEIVGELVDVETGEPISGARLVIREQGNPNPLLRKSVSLEGTKGGFKILVPPAPYIVELTAPGYESKQLDARRISKSKAKQTRVALRKVE